MEIGEFIGARLDEEERDARAALEETREVSYRVDRWRVSEGGYGVYAAPNQCIAAGPYDHMADEVATHIARQDPTATLARIKATRALVALHEWTELNDPPKPMCSECAKPAAWEGHYDGEWPCLSLRHVAAIWSWHPDYQPEWAAAVSPA